MKNAEPIRRVTNSNSLFPVTWNTITHEIPSENDIRKKMRTDFLFLIKPSHFISLQTRFQIENIVVIFRTTIVFLISIMLA